MQVGGGLPRWALLGDWLHSSLISDCGRWYVTAFAAAGFPPFPSLTELLLF